MITKISKLKNFGIYHDFSWKANLPEFKRFNLIYGWNRSGKTLVSRVFASCEKKCLHDKNKFKQYPENGEFEIKVNNGTTVKNTDVINNNLPIKVFNEDFVADNISFDPSNSCKPIIYISEEDIESKRHLEKLKSDKTTLDKDYEDAKKDTETKEEAKNNFLTSLGREIANTLFDKTYNKTKAENKINNIGVDNFTDKEFSNEDLKKYIEISKSEAGKNQKLFQELRFNFLFDGKAINNFDKVHELIETLLDKKIISETIERLKDDQELNAWVQQGFDLHKRKEEKEKCLFCQKPLDSGFLSSLSKHFSKDYEYLQNSIVMLNTEIENLKKERIALKNEELYPDLRENYETQAETLNKIIERLNARLESAISKLNEKYNNPLIFPTKLEKPEDFLDTYNKTVGELNKIISSHNEKVSNHPIEVKNAREKLELHLIAIALAEQDYKKLENELKEDKIKEKETLEATNKNNINISELEKKTSNIGKAIKEINRHLKDFFGREEIKLELDEDKKGYIIIRDGQPAKNLSEGEKTAIAFSYFLVKVKEKDFKIKNGIVFIDDPISSFDSNFIYHCFSLIRTHFEEVGQLFVSTHNFELFNLTKEWFIRKKKREELCGFYMIENYVEANIRMAQIKLLEKTLRDFKSEYHFLFDRLKKFSQDSTPKYADFYTIGNIARRFLEIFTNFKIPTTGDLASKLEALEIDTNKISKAAQSKVYKLIQEFSHGLDPTSTIEHKDKSESQEAIKILLKMVEESDSRHYKLLNKIAE